MKDKIMPREETTGQASDENNAGPEARLRFTTDDLDRLWELVWERLLASPHDRADPFRLPAVGTMSRERGPAVRTVVLRAVDRHERALICHTDRRSPKIAELASDARLAWHFWDPAHQVQLRFNSTAAIHTDDRFAESCWQACPLGSRLGYLRTNNPGAPLPHASSGLPAAVEGRTLSAEELEAGRTHFAVIRAIVHHLDFYQIGEGGQRRAHFSVGADGRSQNWCSP